MPTILLVQNDPKFRGMYANFLAQNGFKVLEAEDGKSGWEIAKKERPDLMVVDRMMPEMDGIALLKKIRETPTTEGIAVIVFSLAHNAEKEREAMELGASDCATKGSCSPKQMLGKINSLLRPEAPEPSEPAPQSYTVTLQTKGADNAAFRTMAAGGRKTFTCPSCKKTLALKLTRDKRLPAHVFLATVQCAACGGQA